MENKLPKMNKSAIEYALQHNVIGAQVAIETVKKGDYFRPVNKKKVYVADGFNRSTKKYSAYAFEDISDFREFKKGTLVEINFEF